MFLQEAPANTTTYMIAGYAVIFVVMLIYLVSLRLRRRNLEQDLEVLNEVQSSDS
jgi:CcmD family protein